MGDNIGAKLAAMRAQSDTQRFQAEAEQRRAMAVAHEQENVAKQAENRAAVILSEAEVPRAIADAFRSGNLGVFDYYKLKNIQSDTTHARVHRQARRHRQELTCDTLRHFCSAADCQ